MCEKIFGVNAFLFGFFFFFFSSRRRHTRLTCDWSSDVCSSDLDYGRTNLALPADYGRVTSPAAKAFLARMYLTRGMNAEALAMANDVIKNPAFSRSEERRVGKECRSRWSRDQ